MKSARSKRVGLPQGKAERARPGPKPFYADTPMVLIAVRVTQEQREKLHRLGGAAWVRQRIDRAKEPGQPA